jgi:L-aminopeptidase/D-esterase-like protein
VPEDLYETAEVSEARHAAVERSETAEAFEAEERMMEEPSGRHMRREEADHEDQAVRHMRSGEAAPEVSDAIPPHSYANEEIREESVREVPPAAAEDTGSTDGYAAEETDLGYDIAFNTTIGCLVTNARLSKVQANKLASILHDAYARAVKPVHSTIDGDTIFVLASGKYEVNFDAFAALATDVMQYAVIDGAASAKSAYGLPSARDLHDRR